MNRVLIIGAGGVGRVVAHKCAQHPEVFEHVVLASRTKSKCDEIAASCRTRIERAGTGAAEIETARVDADSVPELTRLIRDVEPRLVIHVALPYQDLSIMDACLETGGPLSGHGELRTPG